MSSIQGLQYLPSKASEIVDRHLQLSVLSSQLKYPVRRSACTIESRPFVNFLILILLKPSPKLLPSSQITKPIEVRAKLKNYVLGA